jgi:hypothetical protein
VKKSDLGGQYQARTSLRPRNMKRCRLRVIRAAPRPRRSSGDFRCPSKTERKITQVSRARGGRANCGLLSQSERELRDYLFWVANARGMSLGRNVGDRLTRPIGQQQWRERANSRLCSPN